MAKTKPPVVPPSLKRIKIVLGITAFFLYLNSIGFQYTMDDDIFFLRHKSVQKGLAGIGELFSHGSMELFDGTKGAQAYRPVCLLGFAIEKQFFGQSPAVSHLINVTLYAVLVLLLFNLLLRLFKDMHPYFATAITLLFILHPLHTEVVASVKSRDELLAGIFVLAAWRYYIAYTDGDGKASLLKAIGFFALASFTKESSIAFLVVLPLSIVMFRGAKLTRTLTSTLPFAVVSLLYLTIRFSITGTENQYYHLPILTNILNGTHGLNETIATKLEILWYHLKLVLLPWPLTWDYSYNQIQIVDFSNALPWLSLFSYSALLIAAIYSFRKHPVVSFSILFFLIVSSPTNNFFIKNVTTFGERLLFLPSLGMCIASTWLIARFTQTAFAPPNRTIKGNFNSITLVLCGIFAALTLIRIPDWKDNLSLFRSGVEVSPNSSRTQNSLAAELFATAQKTPDPIIQQQLLEEAGHCFTRSLEILPKNYQAHYNYGVYLSTIGDTIHAIKEYETVIVQEPFSWEAMTNLGVMYEARKDLRTACTYYKMAYRVAPEEPLTGSNLIKNQILQGQQFAASGKTDSAILQYKNCLQIDPNHVFSYSAIADLFAATNRYDSAVVYLLKANRLDENNLTVLERLGELYCLDKDYQQGIQFAEMALTVNPSLVKSLETMAKCFEGMGNKEKAKEYREKLNGTGIGL